MTCEASRATTIAVHWKVLHASEVRSNGPPIPVAPLLFGSLPLRNLRAAGENAAPAIGPHCREENDHGPSGETKQNPNRNRHRHLLPKADFGVGGPPPIATDNPSKAAELKNKP